MRGKKEHNVKEPKMTKEELEKHNIRQKELEIVFSDENYYPYIKQIEAKTLKKINNK